MTCSIPFLIITQFATLLAVPWVLHRWVDSRWWPPGWNHVPLVGDGAAALIFYASLLGVFLYLFNFCPGGP
jgi:hypothetical protein